MLLIRYQILAESARRYLVPNDPETLPRGVLYDEVERFEMSGTSVASVLAMTTFTLILLAPIAFVIAFASGLSGLS